eukprot:747868-Hanusia_phi.AAC.2
MCTLWTARPSSTWRRQGALCSAASARLLVSLGMQEIVELNKFQDKITLIHGMVRGLRSGLLFRLSRCRQVEKIELPVKQVGPACGCSATADLLPGRHHHIRMDGIRPTLRVHARLCELASLPPSCFLLPPP